MLSLAATSPWRASIQRFNLKLPRHCIETFAQWFGQRNATRVAIEAFGVALLARQPDPLDAGQPPRPPDVTNKRIHRFFEIRRRHEGFYGQRHDRLAGVGRLAGLFDEIDHLAPDRGAIERPGEER